MTCIVIESYEGESAAVAYLSGEHETDFFGSHFGVKMYDTLNILNSITITVTVTQTAVNK